MALGSCTTARLIWLQAVDGASGTKFVNGLQEFDAINTSMWHRLWITKLEPAVWSWVVQGDLRNIGTVRRCRRNPFLVGSGNYAAGAALYDIATH